MAFTCYTDLHNPQLGSIGPPVAVGLHASYFIVSTPANTIVTLANGGLNGDLDIMLNTPINNQQSILTAAQTAIQAAEPGTPGLSFVWIGLG